MSRKGRLYRKFLAGVLAAAFTVTAAPQAVFADEAYVVEEAETFERAGEIPDVTEASGEGEVLEGEIKDEAVLEGNEIAEHKGYVYTDAIPAELGKESSTVMYPSKENKETGKNDRYRYFVYDIAENGIYNFKAAASAPMEYEIGLADDKYPNTAGRRRYMIVPKGENEKEKYLHAGKYYLEIYTNEDVDEANVSFTLSFKEFVYRSDEKNPEEIKIGDEKSQKLRNLRPLPDDDCSYDRHFYSLNLDTAGVATISFTDDYKGDKHTSMVINNAANEPESYFEEIIKTNGFEEFRSTSYTWIDKDTIKLSLPGGRYNIRLYCDSIEEEPVYKFCFKEFKALEAGKNEKVILGDEKLGGSNDWPDPLDTDWGKYYSADKNGPMPSIEPGQKYRSIMTRDSKVDYFQFELKKDGPLYLTADSEEIGELEFEMIKLEPKLNMYTSVTTRLSNGQDSIIAGVKAPLKNSQLEISLDKTGVWKYYKDFPAGKYVLYIHTHRGGYHNKDASEDQVLNKFGETGIYAFNLSTGKSTAKPVTKLTLDNTNITMSVSSANQLKATVAPSNADDVGVTFEVTGDEGVIEVSENSISGNSAKPGVTEYTIRALIPGKAVIRFTTSGSNSKGEHLTAECTVSVVEGKAAPAVATKQKIDLSDEAYFGKIVDKKNDKFIVLAADGKTKGIGSVSKGIFTAKKPGTVIITRQVKDTSGKKARYVSVSPQLTLEIETPKYLQKDKKKKDIKTFTLTKRTATISPCQVISGNNITPSGYLFSNEKNFEVDKATGAVTAKSNGTCKVTVLYGDNERKLAAKSYTYTVKAVLPTIKDNVSVKAAAKKPLVVKLTKVSENAVREWRLEGVSRNEAGEDIPDGIEVSANCIRIEPVKTEKKKTDLMSCRVSPAEGAAKDQKAFLIVKVDGIDYRCKVTIK